MSDDELTKRMILPQLYYFYDGVAETENRDLFRALTVCRIYVLNMQKQAITKYRHFCFV